MGLFRKRKDHWIVGTARVVSVNRLPRSGTSTSLRAEVVVQAPGIEPFAMEYKELVVSISKFPAHGTVLPVRIDPDDHRDIDVLWDEVPTHQDAARHQAEQLAATMRASAEAAPTVQVTASDTGGDPVERLEKLAALHAAGVIDDAQFAALKQQILGQAGLG